MLRQRVITAIVLLLILTATLWVDAAWPFLALLGLACGCAAWEWLRLTLPESGRGALAVAGGVVVCLICFAFTFAWVGPESTFGRGGIVQVIQLLVVGAALVWLLAVVPAVVKGDAQAPAANTPWSIFAFVALLAAWFSLAAMFLQFPLWFVLSLLITVWISDIAAYFVGRAVGKRKLAPRVSPGKTVAGAVAGVGGAMLWFAISGLFWADSFAAGLIQYWGVIGTLIIGGLLGAISIVGDLFESLLKRRAGIKDSSQLLPGHGGVFDRIDAILPVSVWAHTALMAGALWGAV